MAIDMIVPLDRQGHSFPWVELMKMIGGGLAFLIGLWQFRRAQRWKRVEFVAGEAEKFFNDESVKAALAMLDWSQKSIALFRYRDPNDTRLIWVTYQLVAGSLSTNPNQTYDSKSTAIREIFDRFLTSIERFENFIQAGVVKESDLRPYFHYWTNLLSGSDKKSPRVTAELLPQFWRFVTHYGYGKVVHFVKRYDNLATELVPQNQED